MTIDQTDAPDHAEIWLEPKAAEYTEEGRMWCQDQVWDESDGTPQRYIRADLHDAAQSEIAKLREAHGNLWAALADIVESPGAAPNATVRRMAAYAEKALISDTIADIKPEPRFYVSKEKPATD
jgi:hypothetical protein